MSSKTFYQLLVDSGLFKNEEYTSGPYRSRGKAMGYMWSGKKTVYLTDGRTFKFEMWHNFHEDPGTNDWKPTKNELDDAFFLKFINIDGDLYDKSWHTIYHNDHYYGTKKGFFGLGMEKERLVLAEQIEKIKNGSWREDPDIYFVI
mgnify:CR=1 FL=1